MLAAATEHTGWSRTAERLISMPDAYAVLGEIVVPYGCVLVGHADATIEGIREIRGHGSLRECRTFFAREMPDAVPRIHKGNSSAALAEVEQADASVAAVVTRAAAAASSLRVLAKDVDDGARGSWWLIGRGPVGSPAVGAAMLVVPNDALASAFDLLARHGIRVRDVTSIAGDALFTSTHLIVADHSEASLALAADDVAGIGGVLIGVTRPSNP